MLAAALKGGPRDFREWARSKAAYVPLDGLPFQPLLTCEPAVSLLMDRFDMHLVPDSGYIPFGPGNWQAACSSIDNKTLRLTTRPGYHGADPQTVWAAPGAVDELLRIAEERFDPGRADRAVVFLGTEMPVSAAFGREPAERAAKVARLRRYFSSIQYMAKDVDLEHVRLAPMGLSWGYMQMLLRHWVDSPWKHRMGLVFADFEKALRVNASVKAHNVLASWGWVAGWIDLKETHEKAKACEKAGTLYEPSQASPVAVILAHKSREALRAWVQTPAAHVAGVQHKYILPYNWWHRLAEYRFIMSPMGSAIQTAKNIEALLVLTVPIVEHLGFWANRELVSMGFPIVLVASWEEVTLAKTNIWWQKLGPRLESFRRNCLSAEAYWEMYTGRRSYCS